MCVLHLSLHFSYIAFGNIMALMIYLYSLP